MKSREIIMVLSLFLFSSGILLSCKKDIGNYDYHEVNEGVISNVLGSYALLRGETLTVNPAIAFSQDDGNDTTKYTYRWYYSNVAGTPVNKVLIARTKNLSWLVSIPASTSAYVMYYEVNEKSTGILYRKTFKLNVNTNIADGWLILNDVDGKARLDFFNYLSATDNFQPYIDLLASQSTLKLSGKPKLLYFYNRRDPFSLVIARSIFVGTDEGTYIINTQSGTFSSFVDFTTTLSSYNPAPYYASQVISQGSYLAYMVDSKNQLFFENPTQGNAFGTAVNTTITGQKINTSSYISVPFGGVYSYALMYDVDNKKFMEHKASNSASSVPATSSTLFDPANMNMTLVYMAYTKALSGQTYAILKNNANKLFLARIVATQSSFNPLSFDEVINAPEMGNASQFAIDPVSGYVMYLVGSKVYRYNPFDNTNSMVVDLGTRKVSLIKYQAMVYNSSLARYAEYASKLIICSYDEGNPNTSGKMELYTVPNLNGALSLYKSFDGLGKVVAVSYRE